MIENVHTNSKIMGKKVFAPTHLTLAWSPYPQQFLQGLTSPSQVALSKGNQLEEFRYDQLSDKASGMEMAWSCKRFGTSPLQMCASNGYEWVQSIQLRLNHTMKGPRFSATWRFICIPVTWVRVVWGPLSYSMLQLQQKEKAKSPKVMVVQEHSWKKYVNL